MNILAIDTAMLACSAAVLRFVGAEPRIARRHAQMERGHAEALFPMIREVMTEAEIDFAALDRIAVTSGPGTFTGVRVGVAAARGLALASGKAIVAASSLHVMARQALRHLQAQEVTSGFVVASDARRGQLYCQLFSAGGDPVSDAQVFSPEDAAEMLPQDFHLAVGSGAARLSAATRELGRELNVKLGGLQPDAVDLAALALKREPLDAPLVPLYLRPPDAKPQTGFAVEHLRR